VPLAVTLCLSGDAADLVESLWRHLAARQIDAERQRLGYTPHVTLGIYPDDAPLAPLRAAVDQLAARWTDLCVCLGGLGVFPGPPAVLWAAPVVSAALLARQSALVGALAGLDLHSHYQAGTWMPHITLTGGLRDPTAAMAACLALWRPARGVLNRLDLVRFRPVEILRSVRLPISAQPE
jgi:2'-5' RNA ligase